MSLGFPRAAFIGGRSLVPFPAPPRRTGRAVLPHPAHRHPSPAVFGRSPPWLVWPWGDDDSVEGDQTEAHRRPVDLREAPCAAALVSFGDEQRDAHDGVAS